MFDKPTVVKIHYSQTVPLFEKSDAYNILIHILTKVVSKTASRKYFDAHILQINLARLEIDFIKLWFMEYICNNINPIKPGWGQYFWMACGINLKLYEFS